MPGVGPAPAAPAPSAPSTAPVSEVDETLEQEAPEVEETTPKGKAAKGKQDTGKQPAPAGKHPWSKDLDEALGSDDPHEATNQILLRSQAHTTQVEQELSAYKGLFGGNPEVAQIGAGILMGLEENPIETLVKVAMGVSVDEAGKPVFDPEELIVALEDMFFPDDEQDGDEGTEPGPERVGQNSPEDGPLSEEQELLEWARERRSQEELEGHRQTYRTILDNLHEEFKKDGEDFNEDRFSKLVVLYEGDLHQAFDDYMENWHQKAAPRDGTTAPPNPRAGGTPPREAKQPNSIAEAVEDLFAEERVAAGRR